VGQALGSAYGPEILEWVVIPLAVNLASNALYDLVKRLIARARPAAPELEIAHTANADGDPVVIVRTRR
jgi:hypothetical protein